MVSRGLPLLPSSVLLKGYLANLDEPASALPAVVKNMMRSMTSSYGQRLILLGLALAGCASWLRPDRRTLIVCLDRHRGHWRASGVRPVRLVQPVRGLHHGARDRCAAVGGCATQAPRLRALQWSLTKVALVLGLGIAAVPYVTTALVTPLAASDIYEQQYQIGSLLPVVLPAPDRASTISVWPLTATRATRWISGASVRNGCARPGSRGSTDPRRWRLSRATTASDSVMIYDVWFPKGVPSTWTKVAVLRTATATLSQRDVTFYRTPWPMPRKRPRRFRPSRRQFRRETGSTSSRRKPGRAGAGTVPYGSSSVSQ